MYSLSHFQLLDSAFGSVVRHFTRSLPAAWERTLHAQPTRWAAVTLLTAGIVITAAPAVFAQTVPPLTVLHQFAGGRSDGGMAYCRLAPGNDGNFYGTTSVGGVYANGTVFRVTPTGTVTVLYSFTAPNPPGRYQYNGQGDLILAKDGNFYGATSGGGTYGYGRVFKITPAGVFTDLHDFALTEINTPFNLLQGTDGNFYGATGYTATGAPGSGSIFKITPGGALSTLNLLSSTGANPDVSTCRFLVQNSDGGFYGTTLQGGSAATGTVFKITAASDFSLLHTFSSADSKYINADGCFAEGVILHTDGNFYGLTQAGGPFGAGTIFKLTPSGTLTTLHNFGGASDGNSVESTLTVGSDGNFYGTTSRGGTASDGTVFKITPDGVYTKIHDFSGTDGIEPDSGVIQGSDGNLYGVTSLGGSSGLGTMFKITLPASHPTFFSGEIAIGNGVYYLGFTNGNRFGEYSYLTDPKYIYSFDLGYEYLFDAADGKSGIYFYDFASQSFFYTSPTFPYPYLYDFSLNAVLYYYQGSNPRAFFNFRTGQIITK